MRRIALPVLLALSSLAFAPAPPRWTATSRTRCGIWSGRSNASSAIPIGSSRAMPDATPRLLGSYTTPRFAYGDVVRRTRRGEVRLAGLSQAPIPWRRWARGTVGPSRRVFEMRQRPPDVRLTHSGSSLSCRRYASRTSAA